MRIVQETSTWTTDTPNNVYVLNDAMTQLIAYVPEGSKTLKKLIKPIAFDTRYRTFVDLEGEESPKFTPKTTVEGSKGQRYYLTETAQGWSCSCPGFKFRGNCKHVVQKETEV